MRYAILSLMVVGLLAGCKNASEPPANHIVASKPAAESPVASSSPYVPSSDKAFVIDSVPFSSATLGDFPYFTLPAGYTNQGYGKTEKQFARFPFWVNGQSHWVEGRFYGMTFSSESGKDFSGLEVRKNFQALVKQMGGVEVSEGKVPIDEIKQWGDEITQGFINGLGDVYNQPVYTYLVRRQDGNIWLHLVMNSAAGAYLVGQEKPFEQSAILLPASELKKQIDANGKAALQVNFAPDKTDILPDSQPQIAQVVKLLNDQPGLKLSVNGHTDNTGNTAHNQALSEGRARSVMAALTAQGVDASRLSAQGFGDSQPVADNGTQEGKAKNRRVELVKQ